MATAIATLSPATLTTTAGQGRNSPRKKRSVTHMGGLNSFGGLKAQNKVGSMGVPVCTQQSFAMVLKGVKRGGGGGGGGGGALSSTCNAAAEIFQIAAIMNGLTLVGVAIGFVLLRVEATLEEE